MNKAASLVTRLHLIRNRYGSEFLTEKEDVLDKLSKEVIKGKGALKLYYETLLFLLAYPDNKAIYDKALYALKAFELYLQNHDSVAWSLFNSGVTGTQLCAPFSFEMVKWLRQTHKNDIILDSIEAGNGQIRSTISAVMPKIESEILQDENAEWKGWLNKTGNKGTDLLDKLLRIFDQTNLRPEVRDTLWDSLGIYVTVTFAKHICLPASLNDIYYHRHLIKSKKDVKENNIKQVKIKLSEDEREQLVDCARMILLRHEREMDPMTFTAPPLVTYYKLARGLSVAIYTMIPKRRQPIDSYMGYVAFKNGLPFAYGGSWVLFDSSRTALNVFPAYRGGKSRYSFEEIMDLHQQVYHLKRFTLDPYQLGKNNDDGIHSGAFWMYYRIGFRPIKEMQKKMAEEEDVKIKANPGYRSTAKVLKQLACSRMELLLKPNAVRFDATDFSIAYSNILRNQYNNDRKAGEELTFNKLVRLLGLKAPYEPTLNYVLKNWAIILMSNEAELYKNKELKHTLKNIFLLKANGTEEDYINALNKSLPLKKFMEKVIAANGV